MARDSWPVRLETAVHTRFEALPSPPPENHRGNTGVFLASSRPNSVLQVATCSQRGEALDGMLPPIICHHYSSCYNPIDTGQGMQVHPRLQSHWDTVRASESQGDLSSVCLLRISSCMLEQDSPWQWLHLCFRTDQQVHFLPCAAIPRGF